MSKKHYSRNTNIYLDPLVNIYVSRYHENYRSVLHTHDFLEINYVAEGKGYQYIDEEVVQVTSGDIYIIPVGTAHVYRPAIQANNPSLIVYNCLFPVEKLREWCESIPLPFRSEQLFSNEIKTYYRYHDPRNEAKGIFERLHSEFLQRRSGYSTLLIVHVIELLVLLYRFENDIHERWLPSNRLEPVMLHIRSNYNQSISLEQAASMVYMSPSHFHRLFKQFTGQTFMEYVQNVRIEECCMLLRTTSLKVQDIANRVGYHDMPYFHSLFKRKMGVTPRAYRSVQNHHEPEQ